MKEKSPVLGTGQHELVVVTADNTCHWAGVGLSINVSNLEIITVKNPLTTDMDTGSTGE